MVWIEVARNLQAGKVSFLLVGLLLTTVDVYELGLQFSFVPDPTHN